MAVIVASDRPVRPFSPIPPVIPYRGLLFSKTFRRPTAYARAREGAVRRGWRLIITDPCSFRHMCRQWNSAPLARLIAWNEFGFYT